MVKEQRSIIGLRDILWPVLPSGKPQDPNQTIIRNQNDKEGILKLKYEYVKSIYERENQRRNDAERKASYLIGSSAITGTLAAGMASFFYNDKLSEIAKIAIFIMVMVILTYLARSLYFGIRTIEKHTYYMLEPNDVKAANDEESYFRICIDKYITCIVKNQNAINDVVDNMALSHEYFKRYIFSVLLLVLAAFSFSFVNDSMP